MKINQISESKYIGISIIICTILIAFILLLIPDEKTLGNIIKVIYVHVAFVQSSLIAFAAAGILGLINLFKNDDRLFQWGVALQKTALIFWVLYYTTSMVATYLSWGVWIEWNEPRVQIAIRVFAMAAIFLVLTIWINKKLFTEISNIGLAIMVIYATKSAMNVRHPISAIGDSDSVIFKIAFYAVFLFTLIIMAQINRWILIKDRS